MKNRIFLAGTTVFLFLATRSATASSGAEGASFLDIPVGAGPAAVASAYSALAANAYAPSWNPGGLGFLDAHEIAAQHLSYLESMHYEYVGFAHSLPAARRSSTRRGLGFSVQYLGSGEIARTVIDPNGQPLDDGAFSSHYASYNVSYGQTLNERVALGMTGKWINAKIDDAGTNAYAADLGGLYKAGEKWSLAATVTNIGSRLKFLSDADPLPLAFHAGAAFQPSRRWLATAEGVYRKSGPASFHLGGQWRPLEAVSLRAGYKTDTLNGLSALAGLTAGVGIQAWGQEFAYAWAPYGELGSAQYFSLQIRFGAREPSRRHLIRYQAVKKHRAAKNAGTEETEPEYQQLMELLSDHERTAAQTKSPSR